MEKEWNDFASKRPDPNSLVIYYIPHAKYIWGTGGDYEGIKKEYQDVSHWKLATNPP